MPVANFATTSPRCSNHSEQRSLVRVLRAERTEWSQRARVVIPRPFVYALSFREELFSETGLPAIAPGFFWFPGFVGMHGTSASLQDEEEGQRV